MDDLLQKAYQRRDELRAALTAVENFIKSYSSVASGADHPDLFGAAGKEAQTQSRADQREAVRAAIEAAEKFILDEGRPLTRGDLVRRLESAGHVLDGADKNKVLGTNLWRSGKFLNLKGAGYWPKISPVPQAYVRLPRRETMID
jgi:hypothetical protein